jgi:acetyl-CoA synthetase
VHNVVFAGFSAEALANRINDSEAVCVITANQGVRTGKNIDLKLTVDSAVKTCPSVKNVFIWKRTDSLTIYTQLCQTDVIIDDVTIHNINL